MNTQVTLKIADIIVKMQSGFPLEELNSKEKKLEMQERFNNFFYRGKAKPDIVIKVNIVDKLPQFKKAETIFVTFHPDDKKENWRLMKDGNTYIYRCPLENNQQVFLINQAFDKVAAYLLLKKDRGWVWNITDIIYDFLQVLLIHHLALRKKGIFVHSFGVKDVDKRGLLFAGKSGAGKSTAAILWHKHSRAMVLNDDRIIVRRLNGKFIIYGCPWHGAFSDYLKSRIESAVLDKLFFIFHADQNTFQNICGKDAFSLLYPALFPAFWDKRCLENVVFFSHKLIKSIGCFKLGFINNKKVIEFARKI